MQTRSGIGEYALETTLYGCAVFALAEAAKFPLKGTHGVRDASADRDALQAIWKRHPKANYGIAAGASGLIVLDFDGRIGDASMKEMETELGDLPLTVTVETPGKRDPKTNEHLGKGRHLFFRAPEESIVAKVGIRPGVDVRSNESYVVGPGSYHPDGGRYCYVEGRKFGDVEVANLPKKWIEFLCRGGVGDTDKEPVKSDPPKLGPYVHHDRVVLRAKNYLDAMPASISGQGGHNALFNAVGSLIWGFSLDPATVKDLIVSRFNSRCVPPWNEREIDHKIQDSMNKPMDKPKGFLLGDDPPKMSWNEYHQRQGESREPEPPARAKESNAEKENSQNSFAFFNSI